MKLNTRLLCVSNHKNITLNGLQYRSGWWRSIKYTFINLYYVQWFFCIAHSTTVDTRMSRHISAILAFV